MLHFSSNNTIVSTTLHDDYFEIEKSIKFNYKLISESPNQSTPVEEFVQRNYNKLQIIGKDYQADKKKLALNNILTNLVIAKKQDQAIALSRNKNNYKMPTIYGMYHFSYIIVHIVDALILAGYVNEWRGYRNKNVGYGRMSRIWAMEKLLQEMFTTTIKPALKYRQDSNIVLNNVKSLKYNIPIILKDKRKKLKNFNLTGEKVQMKRRLDYYNSFIRGIEVTIPLSALGPSNYLFEKYESALSCPRINLFSGKNISNCSVDIQLSSNYPSSPQINLSCELYRVFNNGQFNNGGRFYGAEYQSLSKSQRNKILINGEKVVEIDYEALHIRMLYHLEKIDFRDDPYLTVGDHVLRKPIKVMFQMIINAKNNYRAIAAFYNFLGDNSEIKDLLDKKRLDGWDLLKMITHAHPEIKKYFNSGIGIKLQYKDSKIAENILKYFVKRKVACLCIHDSFIVQIKYKEEIIDMMRKEYKKEFGFEPELKICDKKES